MLTPYDPAAASRANVILDLSGADKTGKSALAYQSPRPLYLVYTDRSPILHERLAEADRRGYPSSEVYLLNLTPFDADTLTQTAAMAMVELIYQFAADARGDSSQRVVAGMSAGTFCLDGARGLKGFVEKSHFGFSATLGDRPRPGQKGVPLVKQYGETNGTIHNFIGQFQGASCDAIFTWEAREEWAGDVRIIDSWKSTAPGVAPFACSASVMTLLKGPDYWIRIGRNGFGVPAGFEMPSMPFTELRRFFQEFGSKKETQ